MSVLGKRDQSSTLCDLYIRTHVLNETLLSVFNNDQKRAVALVRRILSFVVRDRKRDRLRLVTEIRSREGSEGIMLCVPSASLIRSTIGIRTMESQPVHRLLTHLYLAVPENFTQHSKTHPQLIVDLHRQEVA